GEDPTRGGRAGSGGGAPRPPGRPGGPEGSPTPKAGRPACGAAAGTRRRRRGRPTRRTASPPTRTAATRRLRQAAPGAPARTSPTGKSLPLALAIAARAGAPVRASRRARRRLRQPVHASRWAEGTSYATRRIARFRPPRERLTMTLSEKYAERIAELLGDAIRAAQDDGEFPDVDEISSYSDHYMSRDSGLFVELANGAEIGIVVQA